MKPSLRRSPVTFSLLLWSLTSLSSALAEDSGPAAPAPTGDSRPSIGPVHLTSASGALGGSERGFSLSASVAAEAPKDTTLTLDVSMGLPILRIRGRAEVIPVRVLERDLGDGHSVDLKIVPASVDAQATLAASGDPAQHHLRITPEAVAAFHIALPHDMQLDLQLRAAPLQIGVAHDGDGTAPILGARTGAGASLHVPLPGQQSVSFGVNYAVMPSYISGLGVGHDLNLAARYNRWLSSGEQVYVGLEARSNQLDVLDDSRRNTDSGGSRFVGVGAGVAF